MKQSKMRILCLLLTAVMLLSLTACGKDKKEENSNVMKFDDCELVYKSACIMDDFDGNDALVVTLDFTNTSSSNESYLWTLSETAIQNGEELEIATVYVSEDSFDTVIDSQFDDVAPGKTLEVKSAFVLKDMSKVEVTFEESFGSKSNKITIDPSTLSRGSASSTSNTGKNPTQTGSEMKDWWNGDWYGWWKMTECAGYYEGMDDSRWDICGVIDIKSDNTGTVTLWDEDYSKSNPMAEASVSLLDDGMGEHGTMISKSGRFTNIDLSQEDWVVNPVAMEVDDLICIDGYYENGEDEFYYEIYLRPWGAKWDDVDGDSRPKSYDDWYLPLIKAGKSMPDAIGADAPASSGDTKSTAPSGNSNAPSGTGLVSEEAVQKGYVWMNEVNNNVFDTTYEELVDYFGVEGKFVKEEYSDHMKRNQRYYKWISKDDENHFIYVNFAEEEPNVFTVSAYNTSGFSGTEAIEKYLDTVKAEAAEVNKAATANTKMKDFSVTVTQFAHDDVAVKITTKIPESGWSYDEGKKCLVENDDPTAFGAGAIRFEVRANVEDFDYYKDSFENYQDIDDRVIGGITFKGRTYKYIGYDWIQYVAQIDDGRALSIGLTKLDCVPGTMPDIILNNMTFQ